MEKIICAAIHIPDGIVRVHQSRNIKSGLVICGLRHHNCFTTLSQIENIQKHQTIQGFITSHDRFVDRKEGMIIARTAGQVAGINDGDILMSEDLY